MDKKKSTGMVPCRIECLPHGPWVITFPNTPNKSLFLQIDTDQASFAINCGSLPVPPEWDGTKKTLGPAWEGVDPENIHACPQEYFELSAFA